MNNEDKASTTHPKYDELEPKRAVFSAVMGGTYGVRAMGTKLLPKYPAETDSDWTARKDAATIDGLVAVGVETLCGAVFDGEINTSDVAPALKKHLEDIDGKGNSITVMGRNAFKEAMWGCSFLLADPPKAKATDLAEKQALGIRARVNYYPAGCVRNWRFGYDSLSKRRYLEMITLMEVSDEPKGRFGLQRVVRYRVFTVENGVVNWELWREVNDAKDQDEKLVLEDQGIVEKVKEIAGEFIGDPCDEPRLMIETQLEVKAYQKESSFDTIEYLSIPTLVVKGRDNPQQDLALGAATVIDVPVDGDAFYLQIDADGHTSLKGTIDGIKNTIKARVNALIDDAEAAEKTATQVTVENRDKQARLIVWADNFRDSLERVLQFVGQMEGLGDDAAGSIKLVTSWDKASVSMDPASVTAEANLTSEGLQSLKSFVEKRHAAGLLPEGVTVEEEMKRIEKETRELRPLQNAQQMPGGPNDETNPQFTQAGQTQGAA